MPLLGMPWRAVRTDKASISQSERPTGSHTMRRNTSRVVGYRRAFVEAVGRELPPTASPTPAASSEAP